MNSRSRRRSAAQTEDLISRIARKAKRRADRLRRKAEKIEDSVDEWAEKVADSLEGGREAFADSGEDDSLNDEFSRSGRRRWFDFRSGPGWRDRKGWRGRSRPGRRGRQAHDIYQWRGLYRDTDRGKVNGFCAGLAEYLGLQPWQVRVFVVFGLFFIPSVVLPAYLIAWLVLDRRPYHRRMTDFEADMDVETAGPSRMQEDDQGPVHMKEDYLQGMSNNQVLRFAKSRFRELEERLRTMESYVTSSHFELQREFRKLGDEH